MDIGNVKWKSPAALAPMAGVADIAFRTVCARFGAGYTVTEMVSAKGLCMGDRKSRELLTVTAEEHPCAAQLFGDDPAFVADAAERSLGFGPDVIDLNMGCPAPKISGSGGGSALMKTPDLAAAIVEAVVKRVDIPVTVKMRTGWDDASKNCVLLARLCEEAGAAAITVHGRTKAQMYAPPVDYESIRMVKESVKIPVIANGDICDGPSAERVIRLTGCDAVMVGRAALGRPWVFSLINKYFETGVAPPEPDIEFRMKTMLDHIAMVCSLKGEHRGMLEARKHAAWYVKGIRGAAELRREICLLKSYDDLKRVARSVIAAQSE